MIPSYNGNGPQPPTEQPNPWKEVLIEALTVDCIYKAEHENNPQLALHDLIAWELSIALDPTVSSAARALFQAGVDSVPTHAGTP